MAISVTLDSASPYASLGNLRGIYGTGNLGVYVNSGVANSGVAVVASNFGLSRLDDLRLSLASIYTGGVNNGYAFEFDKTNLKIKAYRSAGFTPAGTNATTSGGTPAGTNAAPAFTGTAPTGDLNLVTAVFSGTGLTAAGQAVTTTDNQTMTLNECAGMYLVPNTGSSAAMLIMSNTAVTGAPAVFTVQGTAGTDAGAYRVFRGVTPVGTVAAPGFTGSALAAHGHAITGTAVAATALIEVADAVDLSSVTFRFEAIGV